MAGTFPIFRFVSFLIVGRNETVRFLKSCLFIRSDKAQSIYSLKSGFFYYVLASETTNYGTCIFFLFNINIILSLINTVDFSE